MNEGVLSVEAPAAAGAGQSSDSTAAQAFRQLLVLEERVRASGADLPAGDERSHWQGLRIALGGRHFVVPIDELAEILAWGALTPIPASDTWVMGVRNLRGRLLPVFRLPPALARGLTAQGAEQGAREGGDIVVVDHGRIFCGLRVDKAASMEKFYDDAFRNPDAEEKRALGPMAAFVDYVTQSGENLSHRLDIRQLAAAIQEYNPASRSSRG